MLTPIYLMIMRRRRDGEHRNEVRKAPPLDELVHQLGHQRQTQIQHHIWDVETGVVHRLAKRQSSAAVTSSARIGSVPRHTVRSLGDTSRCIDEVENPNQTPTAG